MKSDVMFAAFFSGSPTQAITPRGFSKLRYASIPAGSMDKLTMGTNSSHAQPIFVTTRTMYARCSVEDEI
jgi:hypothetical protein